MMRLHRRLRRFFHGEDVPTVNDVGRRYGWLCAHCGQPFRPGERPLQLEGISGAWDERFHEGCLRAAEAGLE
jgi:hypothetical protein